MQFKFVFLDIAKFTDFQQKNAGVSRNQRVCQMIYLFSWTFFR